MTDKKNTILLGAHMSITGGLEKSIQRGESIGCTCIQIFTKSNRQWFAKPITEHEAELFKNTLNNSSIRSIVAHGCYLINIGSPNAEIEKKSIAALADELERIEFLEIPYLIFHPGAATDASQEECLHRIAHNINSILENNTGKSMLLLETMAGQGSIVGYTFEQLATIYKNIDNKKRVGFCFDTCHAFAAGYNFSTPETYKTMWQKFDEILGIKNLKVFHVNDSTKDRGSRVDRHDHIGKGKIGLEAFSLLFNDPRFYDIPKILETPKEDDMVDDVKNMEILRNLIK